MIAMMSPRSFLSAAPRLLLALGVVSVPAVLAGSGPSPQQSPPPVFGGKVEVASVDVLVLDQHGNPVRGMTQQDFTVKEDGVAQAITSFEAVGFEESEPSEAEREAFSPSNAERPRPERSFLVIYDDLHLPTRGARLAAAEFEKLLGGPDPRDRMSGFST